MSINNRVEDFKSDFLSDILSIEQLIQKYLIAGETDYFNSHLKDDKFEFVIKQQISDAFDIHQNDIEQYKSSNSRFGK